MMNGLLADLDPRDSPGVLGHRLCVTRRGIRTPNGGPLVLGSGDNARSPGEERWVAGRWSTASTADDGLRGGDLALGKAVPDRRRAD